MDIIVSKEAIQSLLEYKQRIIEAMETLVFERMELQKRNAPTIMLEINESFMKGYREELNNVDEKLKELKGTVNG